MRKIIITAAIAGALALAGCENMTPQQQTAVGGLTGATLGVISARALGVDRNWILLAALAGATAGTIVARNNADQTCAVANGDGTYRVVRC